MMFWPSDVAELAQPLSQCPKETRSLRIRTRDIAEDTQSGDFPRWLCLDGERHGEDGKGGEERAAIHHWIM